MRKSLIVLPIVMQATCVPVPKTGTILPTSGESATVSRRVYQLPAVFHDPDLLCVDVNEMGTCATVADVKQFLISRKATP
jgi:hypothetical protein